MPLTGDRKREYQLEWIKRRRESWIQDQGGACVICGSRDDLEVDHIDPTLKEMPPAAIWSRAEAIREAELAKCQVLCSDCHKTKTAEERSQGVWHGSYTMRARGCECIVCKQYVRDSKRASRAGVSYVDYVSREEILPGRCKRP